MQPLDGLLVADFSRVVAGPLVAMTLGDLGARVVKVERPGSGDDTRGWGPPWHELSGERSSTYFAAVNRNKESVLLALDEADDQVLAHRLADRADVLVENFVPGTLDRFGLGWEQCRARNPRLVYCSIEGFGSTPEAARLPGYDILAQAASGLMSITGEQDGRPLKAGVAIVDVLAALNATIGVLAAIEQRHATGEGSRVQVSLLDSAMSALINQASGYLLADKVPGRSGNQHPSIAPYSTFTASDRDFVVACGTEAQWAKICSVIEREALATDERFATNTDRVLHRDELMAALGEAFRTRPAAVWIEALGAVGVPSGPINDVGEAFALAESLGLEPTTPTVDANDQVVPSVRSPIRLDPATPPDATIPAAPTLGQHDEAVRAWLSSD